MLCRCSIYFFSFMLNTLIFTVDNNILKKINVSLGLSQLQSSILLVNTISLYHIVNCLLSYYIIQQFRNKLFCLLTKQVWGKATWAIRIYLKAYYVVTLITKLFHVNHNCTCFVCWWSFILKSTLRTYSKALIINMTHCNTKTWFEFLKLTD